MNKDEMIKDIKAIIDDRCEAELGQVHAESKGGKVTKTVSTSLIAKDIYNADYRKVCEDEIVVKKSEIGMLKKTIDFLEMQKDQLNKQLEQAEQETAREVLAKVDYESNGQTIQITNILRRKYGIELEKDNEQR